MHGPEAIWEILVQVRTPAEDPATGVPGYCSSMVATGETPNDTAASAVPDPGRIVDRSDFALELTVARERAGLTVRALAAQVDQPAATIGGYLSGQHLPPVRQTDLFRRILACVGIVDDDDIERWLEALARVRRKPGPRPAASPIPYRGLESFGTDDSEWFFGRETLTADLLARLSERAREPQDGSMVIVVGPSGSGKSSLLRAGLLAAVEEGGLNGGAGWRGVLFSPSAEPVRALAENLGALSGLQPAELEARLRSDTLDWAGPGGDGGCVVVVDQFEELFTVCGDEAERQAFLAALRRLARVEGSGPSALVVVLGLRADFYGRAAREPALVPVLQDNQVLVGPMSAQQLRRAISEPARLAGYDIDPELVELLIGEFVPRGSPSGLHDPGALPLLSHALLETFLRARRGRLTVADYVATGGINGAVRQTAERVFSELTPDEQALARRVFLRLVNVDDDAVITRRQVRLSELQASSPTGTPSDVAGDAARAVAAGDQGGALGHVLDRFVAQRLLTAHENTVEVSHEALLSAWPRLREWLDADRTGLRVHRQLSETARMWADSDRDPSGLLRGARLEAAAVWVATAGHEDDINDLERAFLDASDDDDRRQRLAARRRTRRLQVQLAVVAALAVVAGSLAVVAVAARNSAVHVRDLALSRQVAIEANRLRVNDPSLASQLALAGYQISATPDARSALLDSSAVPTPTRLLGQTGATALSITANGRLMAVSRAIDGTVQLFSIAEHGPPVRRGVVSPSTPAGQPFAVAFSPNGTTLAVGGTDDAVRLWDVANPARPQQLSGPLSGFTDPVQSLAFSPDGRTLAAGGTAKGVLRWDVSVATRPVELVALTGMTGATYAVAFSPDGKAVAAAGTDATVRLWNTTGDQPALLAQLTNGTDTTVNSVAFSSDGRILAAGSKDKTIKRWDLSNLAAPTEIGSPLAGFSSWVNSVAFSADGRTLAAGSSDNTVKLFDVATWKPKGVSFTHPAPVTAVRFLPGTDELVSVAEDGAARLWPLPGPVIDGPADTVWALGYSRDGRRLVVAPGRGDNGVEVWDASDRAHPTRIGRVPMPVDIGPATGSGSISPDGRFLASGGATGKIQLFDIADPTAPVALGAPLLQSTSGRLVEQSSFSPDGHLLAAGGDDSTVALWDVKDPSRPALLGRLADPSSLVLSISFSADSRLLAAASADSSVYLWSLDDPQHPVRTAKINGFDNYAYGVAFSPDGHLLVAGSADQTVRVWDISDRRHPRSVGGPITGPGNYVYSVAIKPDGHTLAAAVTDGTVWQWDISNPADPHPLTMLTAMPGAAFVVAYSPDGSTLAAAGNDKTVHLWSTDPRQIAADVCATAGDAITKKEWAKYIPNRHYRPPCA